MNLQMTQNDEESAPSPPISRIVSFSGGRSSGMMLVKMAEFGQLDNAVIAFSDTGREHSECYEFVSEVEAFIGKSILRLEFPGKFDALLAKHHALPNVMMRFCTEELKVIPMRKLMYELGNEHYINVIGFRADEQNRVSKKREPIEFRYKKKVMSYDFEFPLYHCGITKRDVLEFWKKMPFDLRSPMGDSNCVMCPLKGFGLKVALAQYNPHFADIWLEDEKKYKATYNKEYSIVDVLEFATRQQSFDFSAGDATHCGCTD